MADDDGHPTSNAYCSLSSSQTPLFFAPVQPEYLERIYALESASYPADEAASFEKLNFRAEKAPNVFMVAVETGSSSVPDSIVGFVCGTCSTEGSLTHESMSTHAADATLLCVHSVVVEASRRRKGLATRMLRAYLQYVQGTSPHLTSVRLLCKQDLIKLYEGVGFQNLGPSPVVHGQDTWYEMALELGDI